MEADYEIIWLGTNQSFISFFFLNAQVKERIVFLDDREWANHAKLHPSFHSFIHFILFHFRKKNCNVIGWLRFEIKIHAIPDSLFK